MQVLHGLCRTWRGPCGVWHAVLCCAHCSCPCYCRFPAQVIADSLALNGIARHLRGTRFDGGALRLENTRLSFALDNAGNPVSCAPYVQVTASSGAGS